MVMLYSPSWILTYNDRWLKCACKGWKWLKCAGRVGEGRRLGGRSIHETGGLHDGEGLSVREGGGGVYVMESKRITGTLFT